MTDARTVVAEFWHRMNTNDWALAAELFAPQCCVDWPQSGERIRGAKNFTALNAAYPAEGPWRFKTASFVVDGETAITETTVSGGDLTATAITIFTVEAGRITHIREFWPDPYEAPAWRAQWVEKL